MKTILFKYIFLTVLFLCYFNDSFTQPTHFTDNNYWKHQSKELIFGIGASNFLGDLGGLNRIGTDYSPADLDWAVTRPSGHIGYRFRLKPWLSFKGLLTYAVLKGDDALTYEPARRNRNLKFRSHLFELGIHFEVILFNSEEFGHRYKPLGVKGNHHKNTLVYAIGGGSFFGFITQGPGEGGWTNLRPLHTEGQGLPGGPKQYKPFNFGIPLGIGVKIGLDALWRMTFELTYTKTFTDYLDDVSGVYYDNNAINNAYGSTAAYFADPSAGYFPTWTNPGEQRGDSGDKDAYVMFDISFTRNLSYKRSRGKKWQYRARF
jgi:hypothetical protein